MFQTSDNSQLCIDSQYSSQYLTIVSSLKHKNTQPLYIINRENPQNSETQNGPRRGLDFIALPLVDDRFFFMLLIFCRLTLAAVLQRFLEHVRFHHRGGKYY